MRESMTITLTREGNETRTRARKSGVNRVLMAYNNLLAEFTSKQAGYSTIGIIGQSCIGSLAAMALLMNAWPDIIKLAFLGLVTLLCMGFNAAVLAQLPAKTAFNLLIISVLVSCGIIIANLI